MTFLERELKFFRKFLDKGRSEPLSEEDWLFHKSCFIAGWTVLGSVILKNPEHIPTILVEISQLTEGDL